MLDIKDLYDVEVESLPTLTDLIEKGKKTTVTYNKKPLYSSEDDYVFIHKNQVSKAPYGEIDGIIVKYKNKDFLLCNVDDDLGDVSIYHQISPKQHCGVSFACIEQLFNLNLLASGTLKLIDFVPDTRKYLTKAEASKVVNKSIKEARAILTPPEAGFTLLYAHEWHRPATLVFRDTRAKGRSVILGQDEDTYFMCELATHPKTVSQAFESLIPVKFRGKKGVLRQGEWFASPIKDKKRIKDLETHKGALAHFGHNYKLILPLETLDSNRHVLSADTGFITPDGVFAKHFELAHKTNSDEVGQHAGLIGDGWFEFARNTALRSFSQEGVD